MKKSRIKTRVLVAMLVAITVLGEPMSVLAETKDNINFVDIDSELSLESGEKVGYDSHTYAGKKYDEYAAAANFSFDASNKLSGAIVSDGSGLMKSVVKGSPHLGYIGTTVGGRTVWTTDPSTDYFSGSPKIYVGDQVEYQWAAGEQKETAKAHFKNKLLEIPIYKKETKVDGKDVSSDVSKWRYIEIGRINFIIPAYVGSSASDTDGNKGGEITDVVKFDQNTTIGNTFDTKYKEVENGTDTWNHTYAPQIVAGQCIPVANWTASAYIESTHHEGFTVPKEKEGVVDYAAISQDFEDPKSAVTPEEGTYKFQFRTKGADGDVGRLPYPINRKGCCPPLQSRQTVADAGPC